LEQADTLNLGKNHFSLNILREHQVGWSSFRLSKTFRRELRKAGLSPQTVEGHVATMADFAYTTLLEADPPRGILELTVADIESYVREKPGKQLLTTFKRFVRFLIGTGRIDYATGEDLSDFLKQVSKAT
jgi:hypothetical protein